MNKYRSQSYFNVFTGLMAALVISSVLGSTTACSGDNNAASADGWVDLFNGKDLTGWKIAEGGPFEVKDGVIVVTGKRSHLFTEEEFKNFEFKADVKTTPGSNSGIFFHTKFQEEGWPTQGYESQVNVSHKDPVKTGSLYNRVKLFKTPAKDNEWWTQHIIVKGRHVIVKINDETVIDYTEPEGATGSPSLGDKGSFAIQAHDPKSVVYYKNIKVKPLAD
ncbi:3-keto-disaccharide hydrolase [Gimesia chilikensis]|uniref:3-keto-disaccharide hydrolase n=1 Tax=Gimesia chilikensis TaxID=2605989 RepID=UPI003A8DC39D